MLIYTAFKLFSNFLSHLCKKAFPNNAYLSVCDLNVYILNDGALMRIFVKGFGCSSSLADSEVLAGCLSEVGHTVVNNIREADVVIYNTCAVKAPTENRMLNLLKRVPRGKKLIVAGCLPLINRKRLFEEVHFDAVVGPASGKEIIDVVNQATQGVFVERLKGTTANMPLLHLPRLRSNLMVDIIPVNYGCLGSCAYCCVRFARGLLRSHDAEAVVKRVEKGVAEGVHEFWLTSQDLACYGRDIGIDLAKLLKLVAGVDGQFYIRVGMMTPSNVLGFVDELVEAFSDEKVFKFLHLPVQSGDDDVLKRMNRFYSVNDFATIVKKFRKAFPQLTLATDVIVGFPGEDEDAFQHTMRLIKRIKPDIVNVSKFFPRPKTPAVDLTPKVSLSDVKSRSARLSDLVRRVSLERNKSWVGWSGKMLADEVGKFDSVIGRNFAYKPIVVKSNDPQDLLGQFVSVRIRDAFQSHLLGELV